MTRTQSLRRLKRVHWRTLERLVKHAYQDGFEAGLARAHGAGRRGRTIRADATVQGLLRRIEDHFGLKRYGFEVRVVHHGSGRRIPARDQLIRHLAPE
jgi:hypothetical protein